MITDRKDFRDNITVDPNAVCHTERSEVSMFNTLLDSMPSAMLLMLVAKKTSRGSTSMLLPRF